MFLNLHIFTYKQYSNFYNKLFKCFLFQIYLNSNVVILRSDYFIRFIMDILSLKGQHFLTFDVYCT